jgi:hypothetical protein
MLFVGVVILRTKFQELVSTATISRSERLVTVRRTISDDIK